MTQTRMLFKTKAPAKAAPAKKAGGLSFLNAAKKPADIVQNFGAGVQFGGFTKANELFTGRLAILGFAGVVIEDFLTGKGAIAQTDSELGLQIWETGALLILQIGIIAGLAFFGFATGGQPFRDLYPEEARVQYEPKDGEPFWRQLFGLAEEGPIFGFNANNELLLARLAMTGFAVTTLVEATTGRGPLEQLGFELGASGVRFEEDFFAASAVFFLLAAFFPGGLAQIMPKSSPSK